MTARAARGTPRGVRAADARGFDDVDGGVRGSADVDGGVPAPCRGSGTSEGAPEHDATTNVTATTSASLLALAEPNDMRPS